MGPSLKPQSRVRAKPLADFKKKKVKLGKQLPKSNVTTIAVKSKKLIIPNQHGLDNGNAASHRDILDKITKQMNHYNTAAKVHAFENCKAFLTECEDPSQHIAVIIPTAMELLYDDDKDTRKALIGLITCCLKLCNQIAFESVMGIIVTFICSGLTSLQKVITIHMIHHLDFDFVRLALIISLNNSIYEL